MNECDDCQKQVVKYIFNVSPWVLMVIISWCSYLSISAHANDLNDSAYHEKVLQNSKDTAANRKDIQKIVEALEGQTRAFNELATALKVHVAETQER